MVVINKASSTHKNLDFFSCSAHLMIQLGEQKCSKDLSLSVQCPADLFSIGLLWPETFFLVSLFAISASFRAVSQSAVLPGAWKSYNRIVQSLLFDDESWMNIWSAFNIISVQQSPHPENHCIVFDSVVDQNISLPILLLSISSSIIIWLTFSSIWGIVIKLGKYLDKFCFIDLKKNKVSHFDCILFSAGYGFPWAEAVWRFKVVNNLETAYMRRGTQLHNRNTVTWKDPVSTMQKTGWSNYSSFLG